MLAGCGMSGMHNLGQFGTEFISVNVQNFSVHGDGILTVNPVGKCGERQKKCMMEPCMRDVKSSMNWY